MPITCQRIGRPPISTSAFGTVSVRSLSRVPRPPQRMTTGVVRLTCVAEQFKDAGSVACSARERPRTPKCDVPRASAARDGGQDRHLVALADRRLQALLEADVLTADV